MATQAPPQQPPPLPPSTSQPEPPTLPITINRINNHHYNITFNNTTLITTTLTFEPQIIVSWITSLLSSSSSPPNYIGLDVEWRPNFIKNRGENPAATLQLCTKLPNSTSYTCLIVQLIHSPKPLPTPLIELLGNRDITYVGVGIRKDVERLLVDYGVEVMNVVDLGEFAREIRVPGFSHRSNTIGIKELCRVVLGFNVNKPKRITMSKWDEFRLSHRQVQYACVDAFLSFEIGVTLSGLSRKSFELNG